MLLYPPAHCHLPVCFSPNSAPASQPRPLSRDTSVLSLCSVPPSFQLRALGQPSFPGNRLRAARQSWAQSMVWDGTLGHSLPPHPSASPSWGTSCPCMGRGESRLAEDHQGSVPFFQYSQDTTIRPGAQMGEVAGALSTLSGGGSAGRTQSHAGPAKLRRRALG